MAFINKERKYRAVKESYRMIKGQRSDTEKINLIEEVIKLIEIINDSLNSKIKNNFILLFKL